MLFKLRGARFESIPYGIHVHGVNESPPGQPDYAFSAGRSSRDYELLIQVFSSLPYPLRIACDYLPGLDVAKLPANVTLLRDCYDDKYMRELGGARLVVIPIKSESISAGQMVLLQAMAVRKPIIITRTATTAEYVPDDESTALLVDKGDAGGLRKAVEKAWNDRHLAHKLGENAFTAFQERFSIAAYIRNIVSAIQGISA